jgi:hypothetical protein
VSHTHKGAQVGAAVAPRFFFIRIYLYIHRFRIASFDLGLELHKTNLRRKKSHEFSLFSILELTPRSRAVNWSVLRAKHWRRDLFSSGAFNFDEALKKFPLKWTAMRWFDDLSRRRHRGYFLMKNYLDKNAKMEDKLF